MFVVVPRVVGFRFVVLFLFVDRFVGLVTRDNATSACFRVFCWSLPVVLFVLALWFLVSLSRTISSRDARFFERVSLGATCL